MRGAIHHIELYVSDLNKSRMFYEKLLEQLDYSIYQEWEHGFSLRLGSMYIVFVEVDPKYKYNGYHRKNIGLNHLAFSVDSEAEVDDLRGFLLENNVTLLYDEKYPYAGGENHYAVYFEDPDRIKLEIAHLKLKVSYYCLEDEPKNEKLEIFKAISNGSKQLEACNGKTIELYIKSESEKPFLENKLVKDKLIIAGKEAFPLVLVNDTVYRSGEFLDIEELEALLDVGISLQREDD